MSHDKYFKNLNTNSNDTDIRKYPCSNDVGIRGISKNHGHHSTGLL